ncbi:CvpA family protein [Taklimakanibacter lacteus]|uniref:CvpA family protein n=1 Tax=Taklimakanibacter lacteus TaxID=2268456 RepID=UPI000E66A8F3
MPFQLLDLILAGIMLISGLLALMRGFTREVLSLIAWGAAAVAAYFAIHSKEAIAFAGQYLQPEIVAKIAVGGSAFLIILIIVSLISVKLSDVVVDSAAGAFDRTLGFFYGLGRGLVLVVIAYLFYGWFIPADRQEEWVKNARSLPVIQSVGEVILSLVPPDIAETLTNSSILGNQPTTTTQQTPAAQTGTGDTTTAAPDEEGYKKNESQGLDQLIQGTQGQQQQSSPPPDNQEQPDFGGQSNPN